MELIVEFVILLLIACGVGVIVKYIRLPYTIALVLVGLFVGLSGFPKIPLTKELVFFILLPPLLFESALNMDLSELRENFKIISVLAIFGVLVSTVLVGFIMHKALGLPLELAFLFGAMISATDPVSVLATFKKLDAPKKLAVVLEGESVLNDGTAIVLFSIIYEMMEYGRFDVLQSVVDFVIVCFGGALLGFALGYLTYRFLAFIDDHLIEISLTLILAYSCFLIAEHFHLSGVIAVVCAGLIVGNYGTLFSMSPSTRIVLTDFWGFVVFVINSIIFLLIGIDTQLSVFQYCGEIAVAVLAVLLARALVVYPTLIRFPKEWKFVVFWGGLRGAIPVALALSLESNRELLGSIVFGVVLFSLVFQGLTLDIFVKRRFKSQRREEFEELFGRYLALKHAERELRRMVKNGEIPESVGREIEEELKGEVESVKPLFEKKLEEFKDDLKVRAMKEILNSQKFAIRTALAKGLISEDVASKLLRDLDERINSFITLRSQSKRERDHNEIRGSERSEVR